MQPAPAAAVAAIPAIGAEAPRGANDPRELFGWKVYDWANSAFVTTVATVLLGPYITNLAQAAVGENGVVLSFGPLGNVTAKSFFPYCVSASVFLQVFFLPILGGIADYTHLKKRLMAFFCYIGAGATCLLFFITGDLYVIGGLLFVIANFSFGAAIVLYNAFLNDICSEDQRDRVSSRGYAYGYVGGGLLLALNLGLVLGADRLGLSRGLAVRLSLLSAGLWWGGFALITFRHLKARGAARDLPPGHSWLTIGFAELAVTLRELIRLPHTLRYLAGYLLYNDGIQTVVGLASVFLTQELFIARVPASDQAARAAAEGEALSFVTLLILFVQFAAFAGALLFERIAYAAGTKAALLLSIAVWSGVIIYAYGFLQTTTQAWVLGAVIALVLGGSQALSRSLFSRMIPRGKEASFYGLYEVSERGTSWIGPLIFGAVVAATNSYRDAILSLIFLFVGGLIVLAITDVRRAQRDAAALPEADMPGAAPPSRR